MAGDTVIPGEEAPEAVLPERRRRLPSRVLGWIGGGLLALALLIGVAIAWLHTGSGRQFIVDELAKVAPASGLSVEVGRIEGSVLWSATLFDVKLRDANGTLFLEVPEVDLNWRPHKFLTSGLDVRHLVLHDGTLYAIPELNPGDPDAPILPNFDIRIDRFVVNNLTIADGVLGEARTVDFRARADIRNGKVLVDADGEFGGGDEFDLLVNAEPDGNRFDLDIDYRAPAGGLLASLMGAEETVRARLIGDGTWQAWNGSFVATQGGSNIAALRVYNRAGTYKVVGQARPGGYLTGLPAEALGELVSLAAVGTLENSVLDGTLAIRGAGVSIDGEGAIDLGENEFDGFEAELVLLNSELFGPGLTFRDAVVRTTLDGTFRGLTAPLELSVGEADLGGTVFRGLVQRGTLSYDGTRWVMPLDAAVDRITSGNALIDPRLIDGRLRGTITLAGNDVRSDNLELRFPGLWADLTLRGDIARGGYALAGPLELRDLTLENLGTIDAGAKIRFMIGNGVPWQLAANFTGRMPRITNATLANLSGGNIRFNGAMLLGSGRPVVFEDLNVTANKLSMTVDGRVDGSSTAIVGRGRHVDYGPFTVEATLADDGPRATLVFDNPLPAAGLRGVRVALEPTANGFRINTEGQSLLGPFEGLINLTMPARGPVQIGIERLTVGNSSVSGNLALGDGTVAGTLALTGGGLDGTIALAPRGGGQGFDIDVEATNARFDGPTPLAIGQATVRASGVVGQGNWTVNGTVRAAGINYGTLFIGRLAGNAKVTNGVGTFNASLTGRRGSRFELQLAGNVAPDRIAVAARGSYGGQAIVMPRRAVLVKAPDGGWDLQKTQLSFGRGFLIAEGRLGGPAGTGGRISLADMPLSLVDAFGGDLGLGGTVSGIVDFQSGPNGVPVGEARVMIEGLTRSGLVLSSRPIDLALVGRLSPTLLQARAVLKEGGQTRGRLQGRIASLPASGGLMDRLYVGDLFAQLRFEGPADSLWRLAAMEMIDVTGTLRLAADVRGTLGNPQVRGSLAGDDLRVRSALTGSDITGVRARGRFAGSRLQLTSFAGNAPNGGRVSGSGFVDLANMTGGRGPQLDLRLAMRNAEVMDLVNMGATVTGPMRIVSSGVGGTIAGRLQVDEARWQLGAAAATQRLPNITTREINVPLDRQGLAAPRAPWRYLIDASTPGGIEVDGMGLDSEWGGEFLLRGTTENPRIGGQARVVPRQGFYNFAGTRFEITRGVIDFDENSPPDPRINIVAETDVNNLSVTVTVTGNSSRPEINFTSIPGLPEEELLARLLFGDSITSLSATDALQLGSAIASLRGGGGMDPINRLRTAIGLDRLRILPADAALDRGTAFALGKNFGRRLYAEIVTDGRGYNATELEFRVTSWLSLLASINTLGRGSVAAEYSRDY